MARQLSFNLAGEGKPTISIQYNYSILCVIPSASPPPTPPAPPAPLTSPLTQKPVANLGTLRAPHGHPDGSLHRRPVPWPGPVGPKAPARGGTALLPWHWQPGGAGSMG